MQPLAGAAVVFFALASPALAIEKKTYEYQSGKWPEVSGDIQTPLPEPTLDRAEQLIAHGDGKSARTVLVDWEKTHKDSPVRDRCVFLLGEAYFSIDDRITSFYYFDEVMDEYPESRLYYPSLEKQYEIADAFLSGYKRTFLFMHIVSAEDEGVEMMYRIQQRTPGSPLAERALLRTSEYYFTSAQYDLAADAYGAYVRSFPRSPDVPRARLRQAFANLAQFRGLKFDPTPIIDARAQLLDIQKTYPKMAEEENVSAVIDRVDSAFAGKLYELGDFYYRTNQPKAAAYNWRFLLKTYPSSPEAGKARTRLALLPKSALGPPEPPNAAGYSAATEPSADAR
jgi:outer membrane assembly lipoprotein YfiO